MKLVHNQNLSFGILFIIKPLELISLINLIKIFLSLIPTIFHYIHSITFFTIYESQSINQALD